MKLRIGLTGGIGSGKTMVARIFSLLHIPVYNADREAQRIMDSDNNLIEQVKSIFGSHVITANRIDRRQLAIEAFKEEQNLAKLNALIHPLVHEDYNRWEEKQSGPYTLREAAILFETGIAQEMDHVILVDAPETLRIERVMKRDKRNEEEIKSIISRQWTSERKRSLAWRIIENDDKHLVIPQVLAIHKELTNG